MPIVVQKKGKSRQEHPHTVFSCRVTAHPLLRSWRDKKLLSLAKVFTCMGVCVNVCMYGWGVSPYAQAAVTLVDVVLREAERVC